MSFNDKLINLLKSNPNFVDDNGELLIAAVQNRAWKIDHDLIKLLISDEEIKSKFFDEIEGHWVFNINTFLEYITQKNFLDNSYTRFRNRIGLTIDDKYLKERGEVSLVWPYKDCVLEGGQTKEEEKRKEIFFNEVLAQDEINRMFDPKVLTNFTRYTTAGKQHVKEIKRDKNGVIRENLIIKGNNLIALHTLKQQFRGKVKLIYIDPPYNTGNDSFGYNDSFNHSSWLTFIKNRLEVASFLLSNEGVIFVHIDMKEVHYLKILLDEIFGRENFVNEIIWKRRGGALNQPKCLGNVVDYILFYSKSTQYTYKQIKSKDDENTKKYIKERFRHNDGDGRLYMKSPLSAPEDRPTLKYKYKGFNSPPTGWLVTREKLGQWDNENRLVFPEDKSKRVSRKIYLDEYEGQPINCLWSDIYVINPMANESLDFVGQKPEALLQRIIEISSNEGDIILDFFLGTGTTCSVAHKMRRQFIGIEQLNYDETNSVLRLENVINGDNTGISKSVNWIGGGDFIYCELMKYTQAFLDHIQDADNSEELLQIWQEMAEGSFLNWYVNPKLPEKAVNDFIAIGQEENGLDNQKKLLTTLLDKNQLYVNLSEINDSKFNVSDEDKALNKAFYGEI